MGLASHEGVSARVGSTTLATKTDASNRLLSKIISTEIGELLSKGAVVETTPSW